MKAIRQLQSLKVAAPGPVGGGLSNGAFFTDYGAGPFRSSEDLEDWFNERLAVCLDFGRAKATAPTFNFPELVICHFDLHVHNLILDKSKRV